MKKILLIFLIWFFALNLLNPLSLKLLFDRTSYELPKNISLKYRHITVPWLNFDGRNYLEIVDKGYEPGYKTDLRVFFPFYPLLIRVISFNLLLNPILIGLGISISAFLVCLLIFYQILKDDKIIEEKRKKILFLLLLFPTSFYFIAFYTESIFLLIVLLVFYFLNKKNFFLASLFTLLATATRISGLALIPPLIWESYNTFKKTKKISWMIIISPFGFIFYSLYLYLVSSEIFPFIFKQKNWNRIIGIFAPFNAFKEGFNNALQGSLITKGNFFGRSMEITEFIFAIFLIFLVILSFKKIKFSYWLYLFFSCLPIFFSGILSSVHRYMLVMFPIYIFLGSLSKKYYYIFCFVFSILLIYFSCLFLRGYWVA